MRYGVCVLFQLRVFPFKIGNQLFTFLPGLLFFCDVLHYGRASSDGIRQARRQPLLIKYGAYSPEKSTVCQHRLTDNGPSEMESPTGFPSESRTWLRLPSLRRYRSVRTWYSRGGKTSAVNMLWE